MTALSAEGLYDALQAFEARARGQDAYPVHKRLRLSEAQHEDVYDWVADQLRLRPTDRVLDVGCGVGFGTIRLAERGAARVTGVTISQRELAWAERAASRSPRSEVVDFQCRSFDRLPREAFDVVVAVESLKHSADLAVTLRAIRDSMAPGGRVVIVEDVFVGDSGGASARRVVMDWALARLYREADYAAAMDGLARRVVDLTGAVRRSNPIVLAARLGALNAALLLRPREHGPALRAFRGGLHLERLYAADAMRYKAFFGTKGVEERE